MNLDSDSVKLNKIKQTVYALELKLHELKNIKMGECGTDKVQLRKEIEQINSRNMFIDKETKNMLDCFFKKHYVNNAHDYLFKDLEPKIEVLISTVTEMIANFADGFSFKTKIDDILKMAKQMNSILAQYKSNEQQIYLGIRIIEDYKSTHQTEDEIAEGNKITEKQLEYRNQIRDIDTKIELKCQLIKKISEQKMSENLIKGYEIRIKELEARKRELAEKMKTKNKFSGEEFRLKVKDLDTKIKDLRQSVLTQSKTLKMKEKDPKKKKSLEMEINDLRRTKQRLRRCIQNDLKLFDTWKMEKNLELVKEAIRYQQNQGEIEKYNIKFDSENYELRRQIEEANERKNRLKSVLDNINKNKHNMNISYFIENAMNLLITSHETKTSLEELIVTRTSLYARLIFMKSQVSSNKREIANLEEDLELRNAQINDLREQILSSNIEEQLTKICDRIQIMADGKIVMKYCIDLAIKLKQKSFNSIMRYEDAAREEKKLKNKMEQLEYETESNEQGNTIKLKEIQMKYDDKITVLLRELISEQSEASNPSDDLFDEIEEIREEIDLKRDERDLLLDQINEIKNHSRITRNLEHMIKDENEETTEDSDIIPATPGNIPEPVNKGKPQRKRSIIKCGCKTGCTITNRCLCRKGNTNCNGCLCACTSCYNNAESSKENISSASNIQSKLIEESDSTVDKSLKRVSLDDDLDKTPIKFKKFDDIKDVATPTYPYTDKLKVFYK